MFWRHICVLRSKCALRTRSRILGRKVRFGGRKRLLLVRKLVFWGSKCRPLGREVVFFREKVIFPGENWYFRGEK